MSKIRAVVLEKSGSRYTVLGENGSFRHVHRRQSAEVGEEIEIQTGSAGFKGLRMWAGVAALFLLVLTTLLGWNLYQAPTAVALLSVDINPSIQFTLDTQGHLIKIDSQSKDAELLLSKIDLKGKPIDKILEQIVTEAYNQKFLNPEQPWVVVGYSPLIDETLEQASKDLNENQIVSWVTETVKENGFTPQVAFFVLNSQDRELAKKGDLTLGEYALLQTALKAGVVTQPDKLTDMSERVRLLENPKVRAQVKEDKKRHQSPSSPFEDPIPTQNKGKDQETENYQQKKDQENQTDKEKDKDIAKGKDKEADKDTDITKDKGKDKDKDREKETKEEKGERKGQESRKNEAQLNTSDNVRNNRVNIPSLSGREKQSPLTSDYESSQKKGINVNYSPLRWGTSRF